jgi:hypothetical protein
VPKLHVLYDHERDVKRVHLTLVVMDYDATSKDDLMGMLGWLSLLRLSLLALLTDACMLRRCVGVLGEILPDSTSLRAVRGARRATRKSCRYAHWQNSRHAPQPGCTTCRRIWPTNDRGGRLPLHGLVGDTFAKYNTHNESLLQYAHSTPQPCARLLAACFAADITHARS